jgi:hypothetical protein
MKNTSGGDLVTGNIVTLKSVASGNEFTTTTTQGDDLVFGVLAENIANNAWGYVQTLGKATITVDSSVAIGDLLATATTEGKATKAVTGDMSFAVALGSYTAE